MEGRYELAEGRRWTDGRYVCVDILTGRRYELRGGTGSATPRRLARPA